LVLPPGAGYLRYATETRTTGFSKDGVQLQNAIIKYNFNKPRL